MIWPILFRQQERLYRIPSRLSEAFANGTFLGVAIFHLLPEADGYFIKLFPYLHYLLVTLIAIAGFFLLIKIESFSSIKINAKVHWCLIPYLLFGVLTIHALLEGSALGSSSDWHQGLLLLIVIIIHKWSEGFALATKLLESPINTETLKYYFILFALTTPGGIAFGSLSMHFTTPAVNLFDQGFFNALAGGTFIYIALLHGFYHQRNSVEEKILSRETGISLIAFSLMGLIAHWM